MSTKPSPRAAIRQLAWQILVYQVAVTFAMLIIGVIAGWTGTSQFASGMFVAGVAALLLGGGGIIGSNFVDLNGLYGAANRDRSPDLVTKAQNNPERIGMENLVRASLGVGVISILLGFLLNALLP